MTHTHYSGHVVTDFSNRYSCLYFYFIYLFIFTLPPIKSHEKILYIDEVYNLIYGDHSIN